MARDKNYFTSPRGRAIFPHLTPGDPDTKFDNDGVYKTKLKVPGPEAQELIEQIDSLYEDYRSEGEAEGEIDSDLPEKLPYEEEEDGSFVFKFKMNAKGQTWDGREFTREPSLFDASGNPCPNVEVGGGSVLRVAGSMSPWDSHFGVGVTLYLSGIQIIELNEWDGPDADTFGFGAEDDGFSADDYEGSTDDDEAEQDETAEPDAEDFDF